MSDALVSEGNLLSRENESLDNEITAALEVGYLLRLAHNSSSMVEQAMYVSRAGFYVSTQPTLFTRNVPTRYYGYVTQPSVYRPFTTRKSSPRGTLVHFATGTRQQY